MKTSTETLELYYQDTIRLCADILANSPNPEEAIKSPRDIADEQLEKVKHTLEHGLDIGGIMPEVVPVNELRKEPYIDKWVYVTPNGLYAVSFR